MASVEKIENEVSSLSGVQLAEFRAWFEKFDAKAWDQQFEQDATSGKLDDLAGQAMADFKKGQFKPL